MQFGIVSNAISPAIHQHSVQAGRISNYIDIELSTRNYGYGVRRVLLGFGCVGTSSLQTGTVVHRKYTKSRKLLDVTFTLSYSEVIQTDPSSEAFTAVLKRGLMATHDVVKAMAIPDFDVDSFYRDLEELLDKGGWKEDPERCEKSRGIERGGMVHFQPSKPQDWMTEEEFWHLIDQSIEAAGENAEKQVLSLIELLSLKTENEMAGFEIILWDLMKKSYHFNVLAFLELIDRRNTSHNQHINFRCQLILYGRKVFCAAIDDPNSIERTLETDPNAKKLLDVSNNAFIRAFGKRRGLPRDVADAWIDYFPEGIWAPRGDPWGDRKGFAKRYPALLARYGKLGGRKRHAGKKAEQEDVCAAGHRMMPESEFWALIQESTSATQGAVTEQVAHVQSRLADSDENGIIGFELMLRNPYPRCAQQVSSTTLSTAPLKW